MRIEHNVYIKWGSEGIGHTSRGRDPAPGR